MSGIFSYLGYFTLSLRNSTNTGSIYANGRNEVEVVVNFIAFDDKGEQVFLNNAQINHNLSLCDYYTGEPIENDGWYNGRGNGEFISDGIILGSQLARLSTAPAPKNVQSLSVEPMKGFLIPQSFAMRVSVGNNVFAAKSIAAIFSNEDGLVYETTARSQFESCVVLTPVAEKTYTTEDMTLYENSDHEKRSGQNAISTGAWDTSKYNQYYAFSNNQLFIKKFLINKAVNLQDDVVIRSMYTPPEDQYSSHSIQILVDSMEGKLVKAIGPDGTATYTKNERPGQLCLTRVDGNNVSTVDNFRQSVVVTLYDQYGNKGNFTITTSNDLAARIEITD
ncbi:hypothetical protein EB837_06200 [Kluyvera ascorbata]|uniref:Uncharacterized protein n=1 Tax=Kluyvera ascorbata TaxID=51288 RepID=A0A3N2S858_9ENTR|nr:hypothetical protein [Kluyvera ascorbata]ROU15903.1 hypothetical protein EB837_06200 [Kluyvera ascorbata]